MTDSTVYKSYIPHDPELPKNRDYETRNVMLDLETLGTTPGSVILSIGAIEFNTRGSSVVMNGQFHSAISIHDSMRNYGLTLDESTLRWWLSQSDLTRNSYLKMSRSRLTTVLDEFSDWFFRNYGWDDEDDHKYIWGNGADFDIPLLAAAYSAANRDVPWDYRSVRCLRTLKSLYPNIPRPNVDVIHRADRDAEEQVYHFASLWRAHTEGKGHE